MESHEVLKRALNNLGVKSVAADLDLSSSLVYKWCQPKDSPDASGTDNPLDRIADIIDLTGDASIAQWVCEKSDGFFVRNPPQASGLEPNPLKAAQQILQEFSELLDVVSKSIEDDQEIDKSEAKRIRRGWEDLKSVAETFVTACEAGQYRKDR